MIEQSPGRRFPIVGIVVATEEVEPVLQLVRKLQVPCGMAYILQSAGMDKGLLMDLIRTATLLPLEDVTKSTQIQPDHIYVVSADTDMTWDNLRLIVQPSTITNQSQIDRFLIHLAPSPEATVLGVLLADSPSLGMDGLEFIRANGGITFTLAANEQSAKSTTSADFTLTAERIADELNTLCNDKNLQTYINPESCRQSQSSDPSTSNLEENDDNLTPGMVAARDKIYVLLQKAKGMDFTNYKVSTIQRRLERRRILAKVQTLQEYADLVETNEKELNALYGDLLINVTSFFRSAESFDALRDSLLDALKRQVSKEPFRVWVAGCSTGQEVYSLAIQLVELGDELKMGHQFQIFATDMDVDAVDKARAGSYPPNSLQIFSEDRLKRFFVRVEKNYQVSKEIRDLVVFAQHNFVADPPFSGMDLISCRNVLIYMDETLQRKAALIFHFALKPGALLFLGNSETLGASVDLFDPLDKKHKIFVKKAVPTPTVSLKRAFLRRNTESPSLTTPESSSSVMPMILRVQREADRIALLRYAPSGVLVDDHMQILQFRGDTSAVLRPPIGTASMDLLKMARPGLVRELKSAFEQVREQNKTVRVDEVSIHRPEGALIINIEITPLKTVKEPCYLICFEDTSTPNNWPAPSEFLTEAGAAELARELAEARDTAQAHLENYEAAIEELQASNEEVKAAYEELQSSNEELESTNEELTTVNEELANRNLELSRLVNDLNNLHLNIDTGIMLLGGDLTIRSFTPLVGQTFNLLTTDIGTPLNRIRYPIRSQELETAINEVMQTQEVREFELQDADGHWYVIRIRPYKTADGGSDGVVLVMVDVDKHLEAGRISEMRYRRLFEATTDGLLLLDAETHKIIDANPYAVDLLSKSKEDLLDKELWQIGLYPSAESCHSAFEQIDRSGMLRVDDISVIHSNGSQVILEMTASPYEEEGRKVIQCNFRDIASRKHAEETETRLASIVNSSQDAIISKDLNGIITSWNRAAQTLYGYTAEEVIGQSITILIPDNRLEEEASILARLRKGEAVDHFDTVRRTKDGRELHVSLTISPIFSSNGTVIGISKIARDITERIQAESALRESEARFRMVADAAPVLIWLADQDKNCYFFNKGWLDFTGHSHEQECNEGWKNSVHPDDLDQCVHTYYTAFDKREHYEMEYRLIHHSGTYRWVIERGLPRISPLGTFEGYIGGCVDNHDQKLAQDAMRSAKELTDAANRAKDQFMAALSHELRTPLSPVLMVAGSRADQEELPEDVRRDFAMIQKNVQLEARLIDDLLDLTRITEGKLGLNLELLNPHTIIHDTLDILQHDIKSRDLDIRVNLTSDTVHINGDAVRIQQVFWNVLKNAVKFSAAGGAITLHSQQDEGDFYLIVTDHGLGITEDEMPGIFNAFSQGTEASAVKFGGLGLGLTISSLLVKEHGGNIWAESAGRNRGASFHIRLPLTQGTLPVANAEAPSQQQDNTPGGLRILLVEDHEDTRKTLARLLTRRGHSVTTAESMAQALELVAEHQLDVVISDLGLPDGSGHELMAEIKSRLPMRGIALSGYGMASDIERSEQAGFDDHLTKPVDLERLDQVLNQFLKELL